MVTVDMVLSAAGPIWSKALNLGSLCPRVWFVQGVFKSKIWAFSRDVYNRISDP